jgi:RNA polymerase sigma-70 factor, ECF subfamily
LSEQLIDAQLIARAQEGDRSAFDALVKRHEKKAYQYAFRLTRSQDDASDIVADAFVRVFSALKNFRGQSAFGTWLYRIITNCALDHKKKDKSHRNVSLDAPLSPGSSETERQVEDPSPGPGESAETSAREAAVQGALSKMPDYQRAMLIMYHVENLAYEEIAEALDLPLGTVKSRLNRARLALRDLLSQDQELFER